MSEISLTELAARLKAEQEHCSRVALEIRAQVERLKTEVGALRATSAEWKRKYHDLNQSVMCELRDPCGTIWEHAKMLQDRCDAQAQEIASLKARLTHE